MINDHKLRKQVRKNYGEILAESAHEIVCPVLPRKRRAMSRHLEENEDSFEAWCREQDQAYADQQQASESAKAQAEGEAVKHDAVFRCDEPGCESTQTTCCHLDIEPIGSEQDQHYCTEHARKHGFCWGCGGFWAGVESFEFSDSIFCENCLADILSDIEAEDEEPEFD